VNGEQVFDYVGSLPPVKRKGDQPDLDMLTNSQRQDIKDLQDNLQIEDIYSAISLVTEILDRITNVVSGNESPDIDIEFDAQTGKSTWRIREDSIASAAVVSLGTAEKEFMVYQRKEDDEEEETQVYGFDYVRGVPATEE